MAVQLTPSSVDFQTPPWAAAAYTTSGWEGWTSTSTIRPLGLIGPTAVHFKFLNGELASAVRYFSNWRMRVLASAESLAACAAALDAPNDNAAKANRNAQTHNDRVR